MAGRVKKTQEDMLCRNIPKGVCDGEVSVRTIQKSQRLRTGDSALHLPIGRFSGSFPAVLKLA